MTDTVDPRSNFVLASFLDGREEAASVARALVKAKAGIVSVGDVQRITLTELRHKLAETEIAGDRQSAFLAQLRAASIFPTGITTREEFRL